MAGLFFCLASDEGAGLLFCPAAIQPHKSVYSVFCTVYASYTTHATKQRTRLYRRFSCDLSHSAAANTRQAKADITPPAPRWSISQRRSASTDTRYHRHAGRRAGQHSRPIIIMYIRVQHTADRTSPAGSAPNVCGSAGKCCTRRTC